MGAVVINIPSHGGGCGTGGITPGTGTGTGGNSSGGTSNHEALQSLLGGDSNGHYHLTSEQLNTLIEIITKYKNGTLTGGSSPTPTVQIYDGGTPFTVNHDVMIDDGTPFTTETEIINCGGAI